MGDTKANTLLAGFEIGRFFDVTDFSFNIGGSRTNQPRKMSAAEKEDYQEKYGKPPPPPPPPKEPGGENIVDMEPVSFTRLVDQASMSLFQALVAAETLDSITVVKRAAAGTDHSGQIYLRVDFTKVLLTCLEWDDDEKGVGEKWKFICRRAEMQFRPQQDDGSFGAVVNGAWSMNTWRRRRPCLLSFYYASIPSPPGVRPTTLIVTDRDSPCPLGHDPLGADNMFQGKAAVETWSGPSQPDNVDASEQALKPPKLVPLPNLDDWDDLLGDTPPGVITPSPPAPEITPLPPARAPDDPGAARLLAAFLDGAGVPRLKVHADDPEAYFRMVGALFGAMVESVRDVLMSRAAIKGEFGVERTMLRSRDNKALKFSVTPADAVSALLQPGRPGYMPPARATKEAFDDVRSHQIAVMAGMQSALFHLLKTFDPALPETRLQKGSKLHSLIPGARPAKLWDAFRATYREIARDADSDFQEVFGREFSKAYNEQIQAAAGSG